MHSVLSECKFEENFSQIILGYSGNKRQIREKKFKKIPENFYKKIENKQQKTYQSRNAHFTVKTLKNFYPDKKDFT